MGEEGEEGAGPDRKDPQYVLWESRSLPVLPAVQEPLLCGATALTLEPA